MTQHDEAKKTLGIDDIQDLRGRIEGQGISDLSKDEFDKLCQTAMRYHMNVDEMARTHMALNALGSWMPSTKNLSLFQRIELVADEFQRMQRATVFAPLVKAEPDPKYAEIRGTLDRAAQASDAAGMATMTIHALTQLIGLLERKLP